MQTRLLEQRPEARSEQRFHYDPVNEEFIVEQVEDVQGVLEMNRGLLQQGQGSWKGDVHHVAQIPVTVWAELQRKGIAMDDAALRRWLDDPDNRLFRTRHGRLSK